MKTDKIMIEHNCFFFAGEKTGFVQVGDDKWFFPSKYRDAAEHFYNFKARSDDVWVFCFYYLITNAIQKLLEKSEK